MGWATPLVHPIAAFQEDITCLFARASMISLQPALVMDSVLSSLGYAVVGFFGWLGIFRRKCLKGALREDVHLFWKFNVLCSGSMVEILIF